MPVIISESPLSFEATRIEIGYLDGIERLDNPTPVFLEINAEGIEVTELMPGSRSIKIAAGELIEAKAFDASVAVENRRTSWLRAALRPFLSPSARRAQSQIKKHDYVLTIKYRCDDEIRNAVFRREDEGGFAVIENLSRIIAMLIELKKS